MAGPPTAGFAQLTAFYTGSGAPSGGVATLGVEYNPTGDAMTDAAQMFADALTEWASDTINVNRVNVKRGPVETGPSYDVSTNRTGQDSETSVPPQVSVLVRKDVAGISARYAGRFFAMALPEGQVSSAGVINASYRTIIQQEMDDLYAALLLNETLPAVFPEGSSDPRMVTSFTVTGQVATQRQRNRR